MKPPSTDWRETPAPGEEQRLQALADSIGAMQVAMNARHGRGRALHRKPIAVLRATLDVATGLPDHARHGLFAQPGPHEVTIRLSNGSAHVQKDKVGDIRGFALKVRCDEGPSALGGTTTSQDFLLINREVFGIRDAGDFVALALAAAKGPLALLVHFVRTRGLLGGLAELKRTAASISVPFSGFLTERFFSAVPLAVGPYAARVRLVPTSSAAGARPASFTDDLRARLADAGAAFDLDLQFFVDEATTPIEDATVDWPEAEAPWTTVARLEIPRQSLDDEDAQRRQGEGEAGRFDPWNALAAHRPLGHIMRARKAAYFVSQKNRGAV